MEKRDTGSGKKGEENWREERNGKTARSHWRARETARAGGGVGGREEDKKQ